MAGTALALLFGLLSQSLLRIDGLRLTDVEPLLRLRQTGTPLGLRGLLVAGVVISALGAVMDVAMSISLCADEGAYRGPGPGRPGSVPLRYEYRPGYGGYHDQHLILAFLGSSLSFIIYLYSLGLDPRRLINSPYMATEVISGIASSIGVILAVPLTALITSFILVKDKKPKAPADRNRRIRSFPKRFNKGRHQRRLDKKGVQCWTKAGQKPGRSRSENGGSNWTKPADADRKKTTAQNPKG